MIDVVIVTDSTKDKSILNAAIPDDVFFQIQPRFDESSLILSLKSLGLTVVRAAWDGPFQWESAGCAVIRSAWNYIDNPKGFEKWLKETDKKTKLINSLEICIWNMNKQYLFDLEKYNIPIIKSIRLSYSDIDKLESLLDPLQTRTIVVKPIISCDGQNTFKIKLDEDVNYRKIIIDLLSKQDILVQPFMESIITNGERSFIVIDGKLSHSVLKIAKAEEFRVQDEHGGYVFPYTASDSECQFAENVVRKCMRKPLYARVDVIHNDQNQMLVNELELIEPDLFFRFDQRSTNRLAQAIQNILNSIKTN